MPQPSHVTKATLNSGLKPREAWLVVAEAWSFGALIGALLAITRAATKPLDAALVHCPRSPHRNRRQIDVH